MGMRVKSGSCFGILLIIVFVLTSSLAFSSPRSAVRLLYKAIEAGDLDADRLERWRKLERENRFNTATVGENRGHLKRLQKMYNAGKERGSAKRKV